jgi:hypothetical protein
MSVDRVTSADSRIYVNGVLLTGVSECSIETNRDIEDIRSINRYEVVNKVLKSNQTPTATISWILGEQSTDPFFDFQQSGIISIENFNITKKDIVGVNEIKSGFLTSYSVQASVGDVISAQAEYEANGTSFTEVGKLTIGDQTSHSYNTFLPSKINMSANFAEGDVFSFPVQSFSIAASIPRTPLKRVGEMVPKYRIPTLPTEASISFSVIKNDVTGMDFSKILLEKGNFSFSMSSCQNIQKTYSINNCYLIGISESLSNDGSATIDFNYNSSLTNNSFLLS